MRHLSEAAWAGAAVSSHTMLPHESKEEPNSQAPLTRTPQAVMHVAGLNHHPATGKAVRSAAAHTRRTGQDCTGNLQRCPHGERSAGEWRKGKGVNICQSCLRCSDLQPCALKWLAQPLQAAWLLSACMGSLLTAAFMYHACAEEGLFGPAMQAPAGLWCAFLQISSRCAGVMQQMSACKTYAMWAAVHLAARQCQLCLPGHLMWSCTGWAAPVAAAC